MLSELAERTRARGTEARVSTMTLIVFFEEATIGALARDRIRTLASKHPSRVVMLDGTQGDELHRIETDDWIELGVKGSDADSLRSAASALRLPDAPAILLWIAPGIGNDERFRALSPEAKVIVYNSSLLDVGRDALCQLVEYVEKHPELPLADIAYLRLAPWQESLAILFDGDEANELFDLSRVEIACGSEPEALYLLGWLASRLGWKPHTTQTLLAPSGKEVTFAMQREGEPRRIRRISMRSGSSTFVAEVAEDGESIHLSVTGSHAHPHRYRAVSNPGIAALLERAILAGKNDRVFAASLAAAGQFLACAGSTR